MVLYEDHGNIFRISLPRNHIVNELVKSQVVYMCFSVGESLANEHCLFNELWKFYLQLINFRFLLLLGDIHLAMFRVSKLNTVEVASKAEEYEDKQETDNPTETTETG